MEMGKWIWNVEDDKKLISKEINKVLYPLRKEMLILISLRNDLN